MKNILKRYYDINIISIHIILISLEIAILLFTCAIISSFLSGNGLDPFFALPFSNASAGAALKITFSGVLYAFIVDVLFAVKKKEKE